jgi:hypothetical protein
MLCYTTLHTIYCIIYSIHHIKLHHTTLKTEAIGAEALVPLMQINSDIRRGLANTSNTTADVSNVTLLENITLKFEAIADCIERMASSLDSMREGCHPFIFYHRVRPFLAGSKANPALPRGLKYEGVHVKWEDKESYDNMRRGGRSSDNSSGSSDAAWSPEPMPQAINLGTSFTTGRDLESCPAQFFSGGSAAQTALFPFLDLMFGVDHAKHDKSAKSGGFIKSMRQYM